MKTAGLLLALLLICLCVCLSGAVMDGSHVGTENDAGTPETERLNWVPIMNRIGWLGHFPLYSLVSTLLRSKARMLPGCEHTLWQGHMCFLIIVQGKLNSFLFFSWESVILSEKVIKCTNIYFKGSWCKCFNTKRISWKL